MMIESVNLQLGFSFLLLHDTDLSAISTGVTMCVKNARRKVKLRLQRKLKVKRYI